ncbi:uncharacterized protein LOC112517390 [Cynara cardunculus var. scolymus]|uniref:Uncharacterized protein n=1 Tax=Cynara cardunculus var. scolymus TaxID=59895 RepID=A0A118JV17_CYNCS|nr:uncharacterized protein LOC112517390 [Cynara cardunculus var. scolymus]KVH93339.1 hypothetical protein Ccrd_004610 [Cynara cardunculus var. scolymus]
MEGLIPFLMHAMKKSHRLHHTYRSFSTGSTASYHLLDAAQPSAAEGSSHRRTRSDFQPPTAEFLHHRSAFDSNTTCSTPNTYNHAAKLKGN